MTATWLDQSPARAAHVAIGPGMLRGAALVYPVKNTSTGARYELGPREHFVLERLDGIRTLDAIGVDYAAAFDKRLGETAWLQLLSLFGSRGLLSGGEAAEPAAAAKRVKRESKKGFPAGDIVMFDPEPVIGFLLRVLRPVLTRRVAIPVVLALIAVEAVILAHVGELARESWHFAKQPSLIPMVFSLYGVSLLIHELGHGVIGERFGGRATEVGLRYRLPALGFYCTVEDMPLFRSRWRRVATAAAGVAADVAFQVPFYVLWAALPAGDATRTAIAMLLMYKTAGILFNLLPLPPLDGYLMLSHALNISRLAVSSGVYISQLVHRNPAARRYPRRAVVAYLCYPLIAAGFVLPAVSGVCWYLLSAFPSPYGWLVIGALVLLNVAPPLVKRLRGKRPAQVTEAPSPVETPEPVATEPLPLPARLSTSLSTREKVRMDAITDSATAAIVVQHVRKTYGAVSACRDVSLSVAEGELFGVLGPNGAGKTTLIEILEGLRRPDSGTVSVLGAEPWQRDSRVLLRIGVQTQASAFFTRLTALEHLETVAALYGAPRRAAREAIERFGLTASAGTRVERLSGGQRQRLGIAAALVHDPDLVFLDEPTAALDPRARLDLWDLMREIRDRGKTIVYTTHQLDEAEALCDRVAIMSGGRVVAVGDPLELVDSLDQPVRVFVPCERISVGAARGLPGVEEARTEGASTVIATRAPGLVLSAVTEIAGVQGIRTRTASLEDVYLALTGKDFAA
ncbi:ABC transporter related [Catenulispora acidiphila DSM 44928]|uniref:ABC transporter related n=2 Tax=Catenulispora TaxID=414878 RepID=C7QI22_CATAD|nr:ABC transporter ATP-binding protein [Catenulispora acidiphila]ACU73067.1 ABC transporter related [Catenulispora acidiphila DSM 44928]